MLKIQGNLVWDPDIYSRRVGKSVIDPGDVSATAQNGVSRHSFASCGWYRKILRFMLPTNSKFYCFSIWIYCVQVLTPQCSRKKIIQVAKKCLEYRGAFMAVQFVLVETRHDQTWKFGYAIVYQQWLIRGRTSAIAAIITDGVLSYELTRHSVNGGNYMRGSLIPIMNPFDNISSKSIVVMDNCSVHHTQKVHELKNAGVLVILHPYSPDYMPIEYIKYYLKSHDLLQSISDPTPINSALQNVISHQCTNWINHCGYEPN